jgi:hypothetical protein
MNFDGHGLTLPLMDLSSLLGHKLYPYPSVYRTLSCLFALPMPAQCGHDYFYPYITQQGLEDRFGREFLLRVTDPTGTGEVDQGKVNRAIGDATELVNSYLGKRYTLPVPFVPGALERGR